MGYSMLFQFEQFESNVAATSLDGFDLVQ